jgi:DNA-binding response OmpR family regulator
MKKVRPQGVPLQVLVVDDDADCAESLAMLVQIAGHHATTAADGRAALQAARDIGADVVLLDIGLPAIDGYALARRLRIEHPEMTLIAVTGWARDEDKIRALAAGCDHHVAKPVNLEALMSLLATVSGRSQRDPS